VIAIRLFTRRQASRRHSAPGREHGQRWASACARRQPDRTDW